MTEPKRILIVEDEALVAIGFEHFIREFGYAVTGIAATGEDAVLRADETLPHLILMDIQLAGNMNGIQAADEIRRKHDIPVIYLTAYSDDERLNNAKNTAPYGYLIKPVQKNELRTTIEVALYKHKVDRELRESEERYRAVITQAMEGVVLFDPDTLTIMETNPAFRDLFRYSEEELNSMKISDLLVDPETITRSLSSGLTGGQPFRLGDQKFLRKDSALLDMECSLSLIRHGGADAIICVVAHDVTERKKIEMALSEANRKLNLLSTITRHDLLNQLMVFRSYFGLSKKYVQDPAHAELVKNEEAVLKILERQIIFTRDYQDLGMKKPAWQNIADLVEKAASSLPIKRISIDAGRRDLDLFADPLLERVFYNLIDNALRYGGDSMTWIRISSEERDGELIVSCEDNGVGIPDEEKEQIFDHGFGKHTGLGLFLIREILGITGLTIRETGVFGKGARFEMSIPSGAYRVTGAEHG
jgi:PAS domain S-box-containing protein